jgi:hypothetical protein
MIGFHDKVIYSVSYCFFYFERGRGTLALFGGHAQSALNHCIVDT